MIALDKQKVTSIFPWITNNIAYNVRSLQNGKTNNAGYWLKRQ